MGEPWNADKILALAPDAASVKAGQGLATPGIWVGLGQNEQVLWGECQGSGANLYQTQIDLEELAFKCSCPSRKFPCKHGLALFLLLGPKIPAINGSQPPWVTAWLSARREKAQAKAARPEKPAAIVNPEAQAKRVADRKQKVDSGLQDFRVWLLDLVRVGIGTIPLEGKFFEQPASRLVDSQAPGVARLVRELSEISHAGRDWHGRLLDKVARIFLLLEAHARLESLPQDFQEDVRAALGFPVREEEVLQGEVFRDHWQVLSQVITEEDRLRVQRSWLRGVQTGRSALILSFSAMKQPFKSGVVSGTTVDAALVYYPGAYPQRALVKESFSPPTAITSLQGFPDVHTACGARADALVLQPLLREFPSTLCQVIPIRHGDSWYLRDHRGIGLPLSTRFVRNWELAALSGGYPMDVFGILEEKAFHPLSCHAEGGFHELV